MNLAEKFLKDFEELPQEKKIEVIDFIEFLKKKNENEMRKMMNTIIDDNIHALKELGK